MCRYFMTDILDAACRDHHVPVIAVVLSAGLSIADWGSSASVRLPPETLCVSIGTGRG